MVRQRPTMTLAFSVGLCFDKREDGWELIEDTPLEGEPTVELVEFFNDDEDSVGGTVMLERAKKLGNRAGQRHAERMLELQYRIPREYQGFYLYAPGTVWRSSPDGSLCVPCLIWERGVVWGLQFQGLQHGLYGISKILRIPV